MKIEVFHLFNDYSGSPMVLHNVLEGLATRGVVIKLHTSKGGVLDSLADLPGISINNINYRFGGKATILRFIGAQVNMFVRGLRCAKSTNIFYINTLLPIGAAFAGVVRRKRVVYHYHENADAKGIFYKILSKAMQMMASDIICVSDYQRNFLKRQKNVYIVPNALSTDFISRIHPNPDDAFERKNVVMIGSLKEYKGIIEFIKLAISLPQYRFMMVINEEKDIINKYFADRNLEMPGNLTVHPRMKDVVPVYNQASLLLNLSNKNVFIETFGMTALEGMTAGLPVIVPTVGGISEFVENGVNGYKIDVENLDSIRENIISMLSDKDLYLSLAQGALATSKKYSPDSMTDSILSIL